MANNHDIVTFHYEGIRPHRAKFIQNMFAILTWTLDFIDPTDHQQIFNRRFVIYLNWPFILVTIFKNEVFCGQP